MAIEIWNGTSWQDVDDPEIYNGSSWVNIQRGEIFNGSNWEVFYIRSLGNGGTAAAPTISLLDKSSRRIRVYLSHTNTTGDNVVVVVYADDTSPPNILSPVETEIHPNTGYTTSSYSNQLEIFGTNTYNSTLDKNTTYYIASVAQFYNSSGFLIKSVPGNTLTVTTYDYATSGQPGSLSEFKTSSSISMLTSSNAYNNGSCWMRWEYQRRIAGSAQSWTSLGTVDDSSNPLVNNDSGEFKSYNFTGLSNAYEHRFRARIVYAGLGNSNSEVGSWSDWSNNIRPLYLTSTSTGNLAVNNTTYFNPIGSGYSNSGISASSTYSGSSAANASDNSTATSWISSPVRSYTESRTIESAKRDGSYVYYYAGGMTLDNVTDAKIYNIDKLQAIFTERYTYNDSGVKSELRSGSSTVYPFDANDYATISGSSNTYVNGTRAIEKRVNDRTLRFITVGATTTSGFITDTGYLVGSTSGGNDISNLNTSLTSASKDGVSGVKISTGSISATRQFSLTNVLGSGSNTPTMYLEGTYNVGSGTEELIILFSVKSDYLSPRMTTSNYIQIANGDTATYMDVYLNGNLIADNYYWTAGQTRNIYPGQTYNADYASEYVEQLFHVRLVISRQDSGLGWYAVIKDTKINFTYSEYTDDGVT